LDPLSQGVLGASLTQSLSRNKNIVIILIIGFLSGMLPDIDVLFRSKDDPLLFLEYHRQFTHSLIFIPIGGLIFSIIFYGIFNKFTRLAFKQIWIYATIGYGTHGLLDACTSYGTQLFWPFSNTRISWNNVSIIDPLFTLPILVLIIISAIKGKASYAKLAFIWAIFYLLFGLLQNHRATKMIEQVISDRGHVAQHISVKPSFGNLILWKTIYRSGKTFYVDAVNIGIKKQIFLGEKIDAYNFTNLNNFEYLSDIQKKDIERFSWFSQDYVAINPKNANQILDIRYSNIPNQVGGLWGIEINPNSQEHVKFISNRKTTRTDINQFLSMIFNF